MPVSQFFSIAREGATTDGRKIERHWIEQMAKNYDPKKYGARVNLEHYLAAYSDSEFRAYGDVVELKTEERDGLLHLMAKVDATDDLVELHKKRQKIYASIELDTRFADTGEAYLVGLAMTNTPASLGTEIMAFAAGAQANPFTGRKQRAENLFSACELAELEFGNEKTEKPEGEKPSLLDKVKALFSQHKDDTKGNLAAFKTELEQTLTVIAEKAAAKAEQTDFIALKEALEKLSADVVQLTATLDAEPASKPTGGRATGDTQTKTDC